mgnify:CR=1 FL=1
MFQIIAKTLMGLEEILAKEIEALGGINIAIGNRMVSFVGDKQMLYKSNLWLRTALRVLKPIERFEASSADDLYEKVKAIDWTQYVAEGQTIAIDNTIYSENFRNSRYAIYRCKDAICDFFVERGMKRPTVSVASADVQLNLHINDEGSQEGSYCTISLDASGEPLYKRGYKEQLTDAPISEVLAAGILLKAGWDGTRDLIDPMCGSGTFLVEAALIATNTPAGIYRKGFGFEKWKVGENAFDADLWQELYDDDSATKDFDHHIYGSDISKVALDVTEKNIKSAGLAKYITLEHKDFEVYKDETHPAMKAYKKALEENPLATAPMLVFNPPYGKRLFTDVPTFYAMIGTSLKKGFQGAEAWVISCDDKIVVKDKFGNKEEAEAFDFIGLKASLKVELNNGGLDCQLRKYEMFKGKFHEFRAEGNELEKKTADQTEKKFTKLEHNYQKDSSSKKKFEKDKSFDKEHKFGKDKKSFKDRKFDKDKKTGRERNSDRDKNFEKGERRGRKPSSYEVREDGTIVAKKARTKKTEVESAKTLPKERKYPNKEVKKYSESEKPVRKKSDREKKPIGKEKAPAKRKARTFDPNRPMFGQDFDPSKYILDFSKED